MSGSSQDRSRSAASAGIAASIADAALVKPRKRTDGAVPRSTRDFAMLPRVSLANIAVANSASRLLDARRSVRHGGSFALPALASVLLASNRVITSETADDGYLRTWRPNPSAGGRHPIDILVDVRDVEGLKAGVYWFDAVYWSLREAHDLDAELVRSRQAVADAVSTQRPPGAVLFLVADFGRTESRYDHPATLVWRDAGALMVSIQFAAAGAGLSSCPAGIGGTMRLPNLGVDVGAVVLGSGDSGDTA